MKDWIVVGLGVALLIGATAFAKHERDRHRRELIEAAFSYGRSVGRIQGMCEAIKAVRDANPDSVWAHRPGVIKALASCSKVEGKTVP